MRFRYLREPLFLCCTVGYFANRLWLKPSFWHAHPFLRNYLDDLLFFPVAFPILLFLHRVFRLRGHNFYPRIGDCLLYLILWSLLFEVIFPRFFHRGVADPLDALYYAIGAFVFMGALHFRARRELHKAPNHAMQLTGSSCYAHVLHSASLRAPPPLRTRRASRSL